MVSLQGLVPGHFAILQAKFGHKIAELGHFQNWPNFDAFYECHQILNFDSV